jgi:hypothetical protein
LAQKHERIAAVDSDPEYRAIEATLLASARGRWFLAEHGRRARRLDNALIEDAITRLNASLREPSALIEQLAGRIEAVRALISDVQAALAARPLAPRGPSPLDRDGAAMGAPPGPTLTQSILAASETVHELAWTLQGREGRDFDQSTLETIARQVAAIYAMSRHQAVDTEFTLRLVAHLAAADDQLAAILDTLRHEQVPVSAAEPTR